MKLFAGLSLLMALMFLNGASATAYKSFVDQDYGFYKVGVIDSNKSTSYDNKTLTIDRGDTIIWINYATPDWPITIISNEGLWGDRDAYLKWNYQKFSYTFNKSGIYSVYVKECRRCQNQTIIVNPIDTPVPKATITMVRPKKVPTSTSTPMITPDITSSNVAPGFEMTFGIISLVLISLIYKFRRT